MEILICQACGFIVRGKGKFCTGCGATTSKFSTTSLQAMSQTTPPLRLPAIPDPLVLERAITGRQLAEFNDGGGNGNGNGGNGGQKAMTPWRVESGPAADPMNFEPSPVQPANPQASAPTSKLGSILGGASPAAPFARASSPSDFLAFDDQTEPTGSAPAANPPTTAQPPAVQPDWSTPAANQAAPSAADLSPAPAPSAQAIFSASPAFAAPSASAFNAPAEQFASPAAQVPAAPAEPAFSAPAPPSLSAAAEQYATPAPAAVPAQPVLDALSSPQFGSAPVAPDAPAIPSFSPGAELYAAPAPAPAPGAAQTSAPLPEAPSAIASAPAAPVAPAFAPSIPSFAPPVEPVPQPPAAESPATPAAPLPWSQPAAAVAEPAPYVVPPAPPSQFTTGSMPAFSGAAPPSETLPAAPEPVSPPVQPLSADSGLTAVAASQPTGLPPFVPSAEPAVSSSPFASDAAGASAAAPADGLFSEASPVASEPAPVLQGSTLERQSSTGEFQAAPAIASPAAASFDFFSSSVPAQPAVQADEPAQPAVPAVESSQPAAPAPVPAPQPASSDFFADSPMSSGSGLFDYAPAPEQSSTASTPRVVPSQSDDLFGVTPTRPGQKPAAPADNGEFPDESVYRDRRRGDRRKLSEQEEEQEKAPPKKEARSRKLRDVEPEEDEKKEEKSSPMQGLLSFMEGDIELAGQTVSKKVAAIGAVVVLFIGLQVFSFAGKAIGGLMGGIGQAPQVPTIAGIWNLAYEYGGRQIQGQIRLIQQGTQLSGEGKDVAYFVISGTYNPPKIEFNKQYADPNTNEPLGKPILYSGTVAIYRGNKPPDATGVYIAYIKQGHFYKAYLKEVRGRWDMECAQMGSQGGPQNGAAPGVAQNPGSHSPKDFQDTLAKIAIGLLVVGFFIVIGSLKLFGPSGLVNIWSKKEFIPSQFKSQYFKMLRELGKGLKPGGMPLGQRMDWSIFQFDKPRALTIPPDIRIANPHMLVLGAGAKGKTRLLANFITHDIASNDRAVVVIDSDGVLIDLVMRWIGHQPKAKQLAKRITIIDPTHKEGCPAYNPLQLPDDGDLQAAASAIVFGFKAIYTEPPGSQSQWNQQTANILRNAALLLMANERTLIDLPTLLSDNDFRDILLEKIEKRKGERAEFITLLDQWGQYKKLARTDQWITWVEPILNRVQPMLGDPRIRPILTKSTGDLNLKDLISNGDVLLVKIPQGQLDQNANLLGSLLVTGVKQAALSISNAKSKRHPTALYLDEFDNFIEKETVDAITSETKKFQIGLVNCIKTLQHLPEDFRNQLTINVGWICCFALAKKDGDMLGPQMFRVDGRKVKHQTIQNIFNRVNTSPQFELISDEEKLNIDRVVGQEERTYFAYRVGTVAGVFHVKAPEFKDIDDKDVKWDIVDGIRDQSSGER